MHEPGGSRVANAQTPDAIIAEKPPPAPHEQLPSVSLVIVNYNGAEHLRACLDSVRALDYPGELLEAIVVENASADSSRELLRHQYAWARMLPQSRNIGFAGGVNAGAEAARGDLLAACNNDMRVDPAWLRELVSAYDPANGATCVSGLILDWEGERIDFAGGFVTLHGFAGQEHFGRRLDEVDLRETRALPFACGGSMLISRQLFLDLGGFDETFFALLEDVDLGWRMRVAGHDIRFAPAARAYHRHGATTKSLERDFLFERNALLMLLKNLDEANLRRFVAVALFLLARRASLSQTTPPPGWRAVDDVLGRLEEVLERRSRVQTMRRRTDEEVFSIFGRPFAPAHTDPRYLETAALLTRLFSVDEAVAEAGTREDRTEELRQLLAQWRAEYGVGRPAWWHVARAVGRALPSPARRAIRRLS